MPNREKQSREFAENARAERLLAILDVLQDVNAAGCEVNHFYTVMVDAVKVRMGYPLVSIFMLDETREKAYLRGFSGTAASQVKDKVFSITRHEKSNVSSCMQNGKISVSNKNNPLPNDPRAERLQGLHASAVFPLISAEKSFGILEIHSDSTDKFNTSEMEILTHLATQLSICLQNAIRQSATQRKVKGYEQIQEITAGLDQAPVSEEVIHRAVKMVSTFLPDGRISFLSPEDNDKLRVRAYAGYGETETDTLQFKSDGGVAGIAAHERKPQLFRDVSENKSVQGLNSDSRSILAVPVKFAGSMMGVINIESPQINAFSEDDLEIVSALANNLASILSNISFVEQIRLQVERQKQLYEITNKIRHSVDVRTIIQTSVEEICHALDLPKATIRITPSALSVDETGKQEEQLP